MNQVGIIITLEGRNSFKKILWVIEVTGSRKTHTPSLNPIIICLLVLLLEKLSP